MSYLAAVPPGTTRWVASRKAAVVEAVRGGEISFEEACRRYELSEEEFIAWERAFKTSGLLGLRASCVQQARGPRFLQRIRTASPTATIARHGPNVRDKEQGQGLILASSQPEATGPKETPPADRGDISASI
jgi:Protein of unknown function (DUF1153)